MKYLVYAALIVFLVPCQAILFNHLVVFGVHPDLVLIAVCLIGLQAGELDAMLVGLALGFTQDVFSGGLHWENLWLKPLVGLMAGLANRNVINLTPLISLALFLALSIFSGSVMYLVKSLHRPGGDFWAAAEGIILPQACFDAILGVILLKLLQHWVQSRTRTRLIAASYE